MKSLSAYIVLIIATGFYSLSGKAGTAFDDGVKAHNEENYGLAIEKFHEEIEAEPNNVSAYYNLGLSSLGANAYGEAIWAFEKVLKFKPNDAEAIEKLEAASMELEEAYDWEPQLNGFQAGLYSISSNAWAFIAILSSIMLLFSILLFKRSNTVSTKRIMLLCGFFSICLLVGSTIVSYSIKHYQEETRFGIITENSIPVFASDTTTAQTTLTEGTRVSILEILDEKYQIQTNDREIYFIKLEDVSPI